MTPNTIETLRLLAVSSEANSSPSARLGRAIERLALETSASGWDAMEQVQSGTAPHLVLLDMPRGDGDGLQMLPWLRRLRPELPIVVLCHPGDARQKEATRLGAQDVLLRPFMSANWRPLICRRLGTSNEMRLAEMTSEDIEPSAKTNSSSASVRRCGSYARRQSCWRRRMFPC